MSFNISEQDILNVFLESDTDEEDCLKDEIVTETEKEFLENLNNLDHAETDVTVDVDPFLELFGNFFFPRRSKHLLNFY